MAQDQATALPVDLIKALIAAKKEFTAAKKSGNNPFFNNSSYSTYEDVLDCSQDALLKHGIYFTHILNYLDNKQFMTTKLWHTSGQSVESVMELKTMKPDMQALGSAVSYAKRYSLGALLSIASEEDDDANKASDKQKQSNKPKNQDTKPTKQVTKATEGPYIFKAAKQFKGKPITDFSFDELETWIISLEDWLAKESKTLSGALKDDYDAVESLLTTLSKQDIKNYAPSMET